MGIHVLSLLFWIECGSQTSHLDSNSLGTCKIKRFRNEIDCWILVWRGIAKPCFDSGEAEFCFHGLCFLPSSLFMPTEDLDLSKAGGHSGWCSVECGFLGGDSSLQQDSWSIWMWIMTAGCCCGRISFLCHSCRCLSDLLLMPAMVDIPDDLLH